MSEPVQYVRTVGYWHRLDQDAKEDTTLPIVRVETLCGTKVAKQQTPTLTAPTSNECPACLAGHKIG